MRPSSILNRTSRISLTQRAFNQVLKLSNRKNKSSSFGYFTSTNPSILSQDSIITVNKSLLRTSFTKLNHIQGKTRILENNFIIKSSWRNSLGTIIITGASIGLLTSLKSLNNSGMKVIEIAEVVFQSPSSIPKTFERKSFTIQSNRSSLPSPFVPIKRTQNYSIFSSISNALDSHFGKRNYNYQQVRSYASNREVQLRNIVGEIKPDKMVDLTKIMKDLRELELLDTLKNSPQKSGNSWKDATRCLYPLWHTVDESETPIKVRFEEISKILPSLYSLAWNVIYERIKTGKVEKLASLAEEDKSALLFLQIHGVGTKYAKKFIEAGAKTLKSLPKKVKLTRAQELGLKYFDDINRLIPRSEMDLLKEAMSQRIKGADQTFEMEVLGSYRRGIPFSSDIDLVVRHKKFVDAEDTELALVMMDKIIQSLDGLVITEDLFTRGVKKCSGMIKLPDHSHFRRIDVRLAPYHSYPYMQLGSTGDSVLQKFLRAKAKKLGLCLNEYAMGDKYDPIDQNPNGVRPNTSRIVKNEKEIFEILGLPYLKPEDREFRIWRLKYLAAGVDMSYLSKI